MHSACTGTFTHACTYTHVNAYARGRRALMHAHAHTRVRTHIHNTFRSHDGTVSDAEVIMKGINPY